MLTRVTKRFIKFVAHIRERRSHQVIDFLNRIPFFTHMCNYDNDEGLK